MNRTIEDPTIEAFHYPGLTALKAHVLAFVAAHYFTRHFEALRWRTPFRAVSDAWKADPHHLIQGPNS